MFKKFSKEYHNYIIQKCLKLQKICFDNIKYPVQHRRRFTWNVILSWIYNDINWREIPTSSKIAAAISYCRYDCFTIWIRYISRAITLYCNMICIYSLNLLNTIKWFWDYEILNTIQHLPFSRKRVYAQIVFISSGKLQSTNHDSIHCTNVFHEVFLTFMIDITMCTDRIQGQWWILQQNSYQVLWNTTVSLWIRESFWKGKIYQHL